MPSETAEAFTLRDAQAVLAAPPFAGVVGGELTKFHRAERNCACRSIDATSSKTALSTVA